MKLYHGTSASVARLAVRQGLRTRKSTGVAGNWDKCPSRPDQIYLTNAYAGYFAGCAAEKGEAWALIEVETDRLDEDAFVPDEDFLEQMTRMTGASMRDLGLPDGSGVLQRTGWFRKHILLFQHLWRDSLERLGNCAYKGNIPAKAITRIVLFDPKSNPSMALVAMDPVISILNYHFMASKYDALTRWLMGDEVAPEEIFDCTAVMHHGEFIHALSPPDKLKAALETRRQILSDRSGWTLLKNAEAA